MKNRATPDLGVSLWGGPFVLGITIAMVTAGIGGGRPDGKEQSTNEPAGPEKLTLPDIENAYRLSPRLYSGGEPHGTEALSALKGLGIRTIISVDGATPDVETARKLGLRYVHLPMGYDGVPREQAVRIIKAAQTLPGPVYVHCHHGKHRGPAAAALCGLAMEGWTEEQAIHWLKQAGTSSDYRGLYVAAREFVPPTPAEWDRVGEEFPERAQVPALVERMVQAGKHWDHLKIIQEAGFQTPVSHPDLDPPHEALQLAEQFRELLRLDETKARGEDFFRTMEAAERQATSFENAVREFGNAPTTEGRKRAEGAFLGVGKSCTVCHSRYRDNE